MSPEADPKASSHQVGRYRLYQKLASGGMASVHLGRLVGEAGFARVVAIKRLHPQFAEDPEFVGMFTDEARLASRIRHPNVVPTLDVIRDRDELCLVMEYVHGITVSHLCRAAREAELSLPVPVTVAIIAGALSGLHAAHEARGENGETLNLVHRDVSPQNVLVGVDGLARVLDFGVAKAVSRSRTTQDGKVRGKFAYMAPEQMEAASVTRQSDVYAAGVMLWEMLVGERLFEAPNDAALIRQVLAGRVRRPSEVVDLPATVDGIVMRALHRDPAKRYRTAHDMAEALTAVMPPAAAAEVGGFVRHVAEEDLAAREAVIAEIESAELRASLADAEAASVDAQAAPTVVVTPPGMALEEPSEGAGASLSSSVRTSADTQPPWARRSRSKTLGALAIAAGGLLAGALLVSRGDRQPEPVALPLPATSTVAPAVSPATRPVAAPPALASSAPAERVPAAPSAAPQLRSRSRPVPRAPRTNCRPPYTVDSKGHKHFKLECL